LLRDTLLFAGRHGCREAAWVKSSSSSTAASHDCYSVTHVRLAAGGLIPHAHEAGLRAGIIMTKPIA
jgi:hypothetical protein